MSLSAVIITKNEEKNIARCLASLSFCDEIIIVDSHSQDKTVDIAKNYTTHIVTRDWAGYVDQKNYAIQLAGHDWVLSVDADEEIPKELQAEIKERIHNNPKDSAFTVGRKTMHSGKWIRYGGWYPNRLVRLFRKSRGSWKGGSVHEYWESSGTVGDLKHDLIHHSFESIADQVERNNLYSSLGAQNLVQKGSSFSPGKLVLKPITKFLETYVLKLGFLDGYRGFFISVSAAYSVFLKWAKLWELTQNGKKN